MSPSPQSARARSARVFAVIILVFLPQTRAIDAWGEGRADSTEARSVVPVFNASVKGDVTRMRLSQRMSADMNLGSKLKLISALTADDSRYRLQNRRETRKNLTGTLLYAVSPDLSCDVTFNENRLFTRIVAISGGLQDFVVNAKTGAAALRYMGGKPKEGRKEAYASVTLEESQKTFKVDKRVQGEAKGAATIKLARRLSISGGGYLKLAGERSQAFGESYSGLGERGDTLYSSLTISLPESMVVKARYQIDHNNREYLDLPRGIYFEQKLEEGEIIRETQKRKNEKLGVSFQLRPMRKVLVMLRTDHELSLSDFAVTKQRFSKIVQDFVRGSVSYRMGRKSRFSFDLEKGEVLHDLGPLSVSSYKEKRRSASTSLTLSLSQTFSAKLKAGAGLTQLFYLDYDRNPRDRDQLNQYVNVNINSRPFSKVRVNVYLSVLSREYVNIDRTLSSDNRRETTYDFRPRITYQVNDRIEITQAYGLNIEFADYVFTENENFLDRNITFSNKARISLSSKLSLEFYYYLLLHDRGSYLREDPAAERILRISREDRKDELTVSFTYMINNHFSLVGKNEYSQRRDKNVATGAVELFPDGGLELGARGNYGWGDKRQLNFYLARVKRFGRFNREEQNDYWVMNSEVTYRF